MILFSYFSAKADFFDHLGYSITLIKYLNQIKRQISGNLSFCDEMDVTSFHLLGRFLTKRILTQAEIICAASGPYTRDVTKRD